MKDLVLLCTMGPSKNIKVPEDQGDIYLVSTGQFLEREIGNTSKVHFFRKFINGRAALSRVSKTKYAGSVRVCFSK